VVRRGQKTKKKKKTRGRKWRHFQNLDWAKTAKIEEKQKIKTLGKRGEKKKESHHFLGELLFEMVRCDIAALVVLAQSWPRNRKRWPNNNKSKLLFLIIFSFLLF
jgi:uncharacterized membrane protein